MWGSEVIFVSSDYLFKASVLENIYLIQYVKGLVLERGSNQRNQTPHEASEWDLILQLILFNPYQQHVM